MKKFSWGTGIFIAYTVFVIVILTFVYVMMNKSVDLVAENYYDKEIKYQEQINKINNTERLKEKLAFQYSNGQIELDFPKLGAVNGDISFYRPSDPGEDFKVHIKADQNNKQVINAVSLQKGFWKIQIDWSVNGVPYFNEESIIL